MIARCFLGSMPVDTHDKWLELCRDAVARIGDLKPLNKVYLPGRFRSFVEGLRPDEVAVLPDLIALDERPTERGVRPGTAFLLRVTAVTGECLYIIDVEAGLTSRDGQDWLDHVGAVHRKVTKGRSLDSDKARQMAKEKVRAKPGVVAKWRSLALSEDRKRVHVIWTSRVYVNAAAALTAIGQDFPELAGVSETTIERITLVGRTGQPSKRAAQRQT